MYQIINLETTDSTNKFANMFVKKNKDKNICGTVVSTKYQNSGKGTGNNIWESEKDKNILASIIFCPHFLPPNQQFIISKTISLGIIKYFANKNIEAKIKWPNDIYVSNKKIAGILIENSILGSCISTSVIGIGLNINQSIFLFSDKKPISLYQITNIIYDVEKELNLLLNNIFKEYEKLTEKKFIKIDEEYFDNLYRKGKYTNYKTSDKKIVAKIHSIDTLGRLVLKTKEDKILKFCFKEVEML